MGTFLSVATSAHFIARCWVLISWYEIRAFSTILMRYNFSAGVLHSPWALLQGCIPDGCSLSHLLTAPALQICVFWVYSKRRSVVDSQWQQIFPFQPPVQLIALLQMFPSYIFSKCLFSMLSQRSQEKPADEKPPPSSPPLPFITDLVKQASLLCFCFALLCFALNLQCEPNFLLYVAFLTFLQKIFAIY